MPHKFKPKPQAWLVKLANNLSTAGGGGVFGCWGGGGWCWFIGIYRGAFGLILFGGLRSATPLSQPIIPINQTAQFAQLGCTCNTIHHSVGKVGGANSSPCDRLLVAGTFVKHPCLRVPAAALLQPFIHLDPIQS